MEQLKQILCYKYVHIEVCIRVTCNHNFEFILVIETT